jgi:hypothetical protein
MIESIELIQPSCPLRVQQSIKESGEREAPVSDGEREIGGEKEEIIRRNFPLTPANAKK